jgi:hypothetical protein
MSTGDAADDPVGPAVVRMVLGARMRLLREASGITCANAGYVIRGSHSKISRMERGLIGVKQRDVSDLLTLYGVSEHAERNAMFALVEKANEPGWLHEYIDVLSSAEETRLELEQCAALIRCYDNQFIPGLLQTEDYARAHIRQRHPGASQAELARRLGLLLKRQAMLRRAEPGRLWAIIDEAALRRRPGSILTMRRQLRWLTEISAQPNITIQVMPFSTGATAAAAITVLRFAEPEVADAVYLDQFTGPVYVGRPAEVQHYTHIVDRLCTKAGQPASTPAFLRQLIKQL